MGDLFDQVTAFLAQPRVFFADRSADAGLNLQNCVSRLALLDPFLRSHELVQLAGRASRLILDGCVGKAELIVRVKSKTLEECVCERLKEDLTDFVEH